MKLTWSAIALLAIGISGAAFAQEKRLVAVGSGGRKLALVIGNSSYKAGVLENPVNDAADMRRALRDKGFTVSECCDNVDFRKLTNTIDVWTSGLQKDDVAVFYYSGHGIRVDRTDYLVPIDYSSSYTEADVPYVTYPVDRLQDKMEERGTKANLIILDACRNNPFVFGKSSEQGMAPIIAGVGTLVIFAAAPGRTASLTAGRNSLFTQVLLEELKAPTVSLRTLKDNVKDNVAAISGRAQIPYIDDNMVGDLVLGATSVAVAEPTRAAASAGAIDLAAANKPSRAPRLLGWAVGEKGTILHTENGGGSWQLQASGTTEDLDSITFATPQLGWIVGGWTTILQTEDGGNTWKPGGKPPQLAPLIRGGAKGWEAYYSVVFPTPQSGWISAEESSILHTPDGGRSWKLQHSESRHLTGIKSVVFVTPQNGWAVGENCTILQTVDEGLHWQAKHLDKNELAKGHLVGGCSDSFDSIAFATPQSGWIVGSTGVILHTSDGGNSWKREASNGWDAYYSVAFATPQVGWIVGHNGAILHTEDGGGTWKNQDTGTHASFGSVAFTTPQSGWVVGSDGTILHTEDGGHSWKSQDSGTKAQLTSVAFVKAQ